MSIRVEHITKLYGAQKAVDDISFSVEKGELVGFLGPNGAGKSTLMKIITGFLFADSGDVFVNGQKMDTEVNDIRARIGYLPEHNPLYPDLFVKEYLEMVAGFYQLRNKRTRVAEIVEMTGLGSEQHKKIRALSKGYRQRVGLAQALIHDPSILILDEPTTGLDPNQLEEIRTLIRGISKDKTVLFSTHIMQEVEAVCRRVLIINKGILVADDRVDALKGGRLRQAQSVLVEFAETPDLEKLQGQEWVKNLRRTSERTFLVDSASEEDIRPLLFRFATENQFTLLTLQEQKQSLENVFRQLTTNSE
ncbi:MAG: gliding motility-associated ABC transporter ATP-binding subunit GldA [Prolixibacteraceae bacterium]|jgi:ABC-2 type transport system ATP-binding protein|nr:gliding motility-associated ABC transporter ATP-binding subunit GldA [Prolixibacteraceae bacterium]